MLRDPIACKPAVLAETDDWVAMASEYRAIATLPGAEDAVIWEPEPATVYSWERERDERHETVEVVDLAQTPLRELNQRLHDLSREPGPAAGA